MSTTKLDEVAGIAQTTDGATYVTAITYTVPQNSVIMIWFYALGLRSTSDAAGTLVHVGTFVDSAGTVTQIGSNDAQVSQADAAYLADLVISGTNILCKVRGIVSTTVNWNCFARVFIYTL